MDRFDEIARELAEGAAIRYGRGVSDALTNAIASALRAAVAEEREAIAADYETRAAQIEALGARPEVVAKLRSEARWVRARGKL